MRAVVIGGAGFLGSHLIEGLLEQKYTVLCVDREGCNLDYIKTMDVEFQAADVLNQESIEKLLKKDDIVYHLAAYLGKAQVSEEQYYALNVGGVENVLKAAINKKAAKFVFPSSMAAIGPLGSVAKPMNEDSTCKPQTMYGKSKLAAEKKIAEIAKDKITAVIFRPPPFFGPRANPITAASILFSKMKAKTMFIIGDTKNYFPIMYVGNLVWSLICLTEKNESGITTYVISDDDPITLEEVLMNLRNSIGTNKKIVHLPYGVAFVIASVLGFIGKVFRFQPQLTMDIVDGIAKSVYFYDLSKAKNDGYKAKYAFNDGVNKTVSWLKKQ
ncbi:MAG: NAD(P)-dependent oxidoreductase [Spirochaetaceae bacterium]